eukprot:1341978-Ditylum_brightwellii.AAC.1
MQYFGRLMEDAEEESMSKNELDERKNMMLLKIKSGTHLQCKMAMRQMMEKAHSFGVGLFFN